MNRRGFLGFLSALPFMKWVKPNPCPAPDTKLSCVQCGNHTAIVVKGLCHSCYVYPPGAPDGTALFGSHASGNLVLICRDEVKQQWRWGFPKGYLPTSSNANGNASVPTA